MTHVEDSLVKAGVPGLDEVLFGGLPKRGSYLVAGEPGTGKTTLGLQFLLEGRRTGERSLFVTISQDRHDLERMSASHGLSLDGLVVEEISPLDVSRAAEDRQSVIDTSQTELSGLMERLRTAIHDAHAERVVIDSLFELRLLAGDMLRYRRELLLLRDLVSEMGATALFLDYQDEAMGDRQLEGLANGVIVLERDTPPFGAELRRMHVSKMRGHDFVGGHHDLTIRRGGVAVFPRVVPELSDEILTDASISCGIDELDRMLGGGLQPGTACLVVGQSGTGKSTLATAYAQAAAGDGQRAAMFLFEERPEVFRRRSADLGFHVGELEDSGMLSLQHFNPAEVSPGQFAQEVVAAVEERGAKVIVIDSLSGYLGALPEGRRLVTPLHALLAYLSRRDVLTILTMTRPGLLTGEDRTAVDASYLADSAILLRHEEDGSRLRRTITVLKKRHGDHEHAVREFRIGGQSVTVGGPNGHDSSERPRLTVV